MTDKLRIELKSSTAGVDQLVDSFETGSRPATAYRPECTAP